MMTDDYRPPLRKVGIALIAVGVGDIAWMIYCISHGMKYSSSSNVFSVIAGILLIRGGLRTANIVAFLSAMTISGSIGVTIMTPMFIPLDLICTYWKLRFIATLGSSLLAIATTLFCYWVYKVLTTAAVSAATAEKYPKWTSWWRRPRTGFFSGFILVLVVSISLLRLMHGKTAVRAVVEAQRQVGEHYKFAVTHLHTFSAGGITTVKGIVTAYNDKEIRTIPVDWQQ